jgi:hypothetical protein
MPKFHAVIDESFLGADPAPLLSEFFMVRIY